MPIPHQPSADNAIIDLGTRWPQEDVKVIVSNAEYEAERSGAKELTRVHVLAAEEGHIRVTGKQPKTKQS